MGLKEMRILKVHNDDIAMNKMGHNSESNYARIEQSKVATKVKYLGTALLSCW